LKRWLIGILLVGVALAAGYGLVVANWSYSTGERAGWVQKFSHKGWLCKTWEGEMAMVTMPGTMSEKFVFTAWNPDVVSQITASMGRRVALSYEQKKGLPSSCFGDSEYWVTGVRVLADTPEIPGPAAPAAAAPAAPTAPVK